MCGLVGFSSKENFDKQKIKTLIMWNALARGLDSTGLYSPINGLKKSLLSGDDFVVEDKEDFKEDKFLIAHVRAKTVGKNSIENTHPFNRGKYILAHNGTLKNHIDLIDKYDLNIANYNVDSDIVCGSLDKSNNIFDVIKSIDGPAVFMITDTTDINTLYIFRNKERPLFKGYIGADMYISSIAESLKFIDCINIKEFKEDTLYKIKDGTIVTSSKIKNDPYKMPIIYSPIVYPQNCFYINCWVKAKFNIQFIDKNYKFNMIKGKYYKTIKLETLSTIKIIDDVSKTNWTININNIEESDIIKQNDYVKLLVDIKSKVSDIILLKENDVVLVRNLWENGDISVYDPIEENFIALIEKSNVIKLDYDEIFNYKTQNKILINQKNIDENQKFLDFIENGSELNNNPKPNCINYDADIKDEKEEDNEDIEDEYYNLLVNEDELTNYFETIDNELEKLNGLISKNKTSIPELQQLIVNLIDMNYKNAGYFIQPIITT